MKLGTVLAFLALFLLCMVPAHAAWETIATCAASTPGAKPTLTVWGRAEVDANGERALRVQIFIDTDEPIVKDKIEIADAVLSVPGQQSFSGITVVGERRGDVHRAIMELTNYAEVLPAIIRGFEIRLDVGGDSVSIDLSGSAKAVFFVNKCLE